MSFSLISELWKGRIAGQQYNAISAKEFLTSLARSLILWTHANDAMIVICVCKLTMSLEKCLAKQCQCYKTGGCCLVGEVAKHSRNWSRTLLC